MICVENLQKLFFLGEINLDLLTKVPLLYDSNTDIHTDRHTDKITDRQKY